jgi:hypothetical protein
VSGLRFIPPPFQPPSQASGAGLAISAGAGAVALSDIVVVGAPIQAGPGNAGLAAFSSEVHASRCKFFGAPGNFGNGGAGVAVNGGSFAACDSVFNGGMGVFSFAGRGSGLEVTNAFATLSRCESTGGAGGTVGGAGVLVYSGGFVRVAGTSAHTFQEGTSVLSPGAPAIWGFSGSAIVHGSVIRLSNGQIRFE